MRTTARLRDRQVLTAQMAALSVHVGGDRSRQDVPTEFHRGALDALVWVIDGGPAPLSGVLAVIPVTLEMIVTELAAAEDIIYGRPSRHRDYARGVEHALMWAQFATAAPPLPQPTPSPAGSSRTLPASSRGQARPR